MNPEVHMISSQEGLFLKVGPRCRMGESWAIMAKEGPSLQERLPSIRELNFKAQIH